MPGFRVEMTSGEQGADEALFDAYIRACYSIYLDDRLVTIRIGEKPPPGRLPFPLMLVTAWNPGRERLGKKVNHTANHRLERELSQAGLLYRPAVATDEDGTHTEPGFAVLGLSANEARSLGRRYHQYAVVYWDGTQVRLLDCRV